MPRTSGIHTKRRTASRAALIVVAGYLAIAFAGCGGSDKPKQDPNAGAEAAITKVLGQLQEASVAGDGQRICAQIFTPKLANSVTDSAKSGSCAKEVKAKLFSPRTKLTVQDVNVTDPANATATIKEANGNVSTVFFVRQSGRWRIRSVQPA
ncbi:MAG: hypothetical protein LC790_01765 [Actinobacteria bacterium]|nr:hypothetical protein [Actinomycetota bacterium]MCA1697681.1 hypothetical protein [Actinomycetota bacterium]